MRVSRLLASAQATTMLFGLKVGFPQLAGKTTLVALPAGIARSTTRAPASGSTLRITDRDMRRLLGGWGDPIRWRGGNCKPLNIRTISAVGTGLAGGPPRRSQRALLAHWAPALGVGGE